MLKLVSRGLHTEAYISSCTWGLSKEAIHVSHPLLHQAAISSHPREYLERVSVLFAEFGPPAQDSGNVSYGVEIDGRRYFVKTAGDPKYANPFFSHSERVAALRNAVRLAQECDHPALARLYHTIESPFGPVLVYEWIEGDLIGVPRELRTDPRSPFQRFRSLPPTRIEACLDVIYQLHRDLARLGWVAVDFYDGCMIYDFASHRIRIIDLDMYRDGPFVNDMGRMFGSSRFMAPEEFELGSVIDQRTTVFTMGRVAAVFMSDGTLDRESFRGSSLLYDVMRKACQSRREERYETVSQFHDAWIQARSLQSRGRGLTS